MKKTIIVLSVIAVLLLGVTVSAYTYAFREIKGLSIEMDIQDEVEARKILDTVKNNHETSKPAKKSQESLVLEQESAPKPQHVQSAPVQQKVQVEAKKPHQTNKKPQPERIPFTDKQVTPGDPESYADTYGQCPFYENAMSPKGCTPLPNIECNEDWSICKLKEN